MSKDRLEVDFRAGIDAASTSTAFDDPWRDNRLHLPLVNAVRQANGEPSASPPPPPSPAATNPTCPKSGGNALLASVLQDDAFTLVSAQCIDYALHEL